MPSRRTLLRRLPVLALPWLCAHAAAADLPLRHLLGPWTGTERNPNGRVDTIEFEFKINGRFSGSARIPGQPDWRFEGDWAVRDRQLLWAYTGSSVPLAPELREDVDDIVSLSADRLVLRSRRIGQERTYTRPR